MCGIAGILALSPGQDNTAAVRQMAAVLHHRGPDDEGYYDDDRVALGHKRLSIIDLDGGHQPMTNEDGTLWLVYNGEIYNYRELIPELQNLGHTFKTRCDTEVVLHAYEQWGEECVHRFNGMWAFAVWDKKKAAVFASRDRFGIKPFYFCRDDERFVFASEIKAILEAGVKPEVNHAAIADYFAFLYTFGAHTFFKGILQLEPGQNLHCSADGNFRITTWWRLGETNTGGGLDADGLGELLHDAVRLRLRSDVPLGCYLSGGLDSSTVSVLAARQSDAPVTAFTASFAEGGIYDESGYARDVVDHAGLDGHELKPGLDGFWKDLPKVMWHLDQPFEGPQVYAKYCVSRLAAEQVKVCLGGQGGDEVFVGYPRYLMAWLESGLRHGTADGDRLAMLSAWWRLAPGRSKVRFACQGLNVGTASEHFLHFAAINRAAQWSEIFTDDFREQLNGYSPFNQYAGRFGQFDDGLAALQAYELGTFLQGLLHCEDRVSMAWGLESRLPLLDWRLAEGLFAMTPRARTAGYELKGLLRAAAAPYLPGSVVNRRDKLGFPTPFRLWAEQDLRQPIRELLGDSFLVRDGIIDRKFLEHQLAAPGYSDMAGLTLWAMVATETWHNVFF